METYYGQITSPLDALLIFEACRQGILKRVTRRPFQQQREAIRPGSVFVWIEAEADIQRWTDGRIWSASRVSGPFLTYQEVTNHKRAMVKQTFSTSTVLGEKLHLISYSLRQGLKSDDQGHNDTQRLMQPSRDPQLSNLNIPHGLYPDIVTTQPASHSSSSSTSGHDITIVRSSSVQSKHRYSGDKGVYYDSPAIPTSHGFPYATILPQRVATNHNSDLTMLAGLAREYIQIPRSQYSEPIRIPGGKNPYSMSSNENKYQLPPIPQIHGEAQNTHKNTVSGQIQGTNQNINDIIHRHDSPGMPFTIDTNISKKPIVIRDGLTPEDARALRLLENSTSL